MEELTAALCQSFKFTFLSLGKNEGRIKAQYNHMTKDKKNWGTERMTAFTCAMNHLIWYHYDNGNESVARLYDELWRKIDGYAMRNLKGDDLSFFIRYLD